MKRLFGIPFCLLLALTACGGGEKPSKPQPKDPPIAHIAASLQGEPVGPGDLLSLGDRVVVSGEGSTGEGELEYRWTLHRPDGSEAAFEFGDEPKNAFTVDEGGKFTVELVVADVNGESEPATLELKVAYRAPTAVLELSAPDPTVALDDEVVADGSGSTDPLGLPLTYQFRLIKRPPGSQAAIEAEGPTASFLPDRGGTYEVGLRVRNETTISDEVTQSVVVEPPRNRPPTANAGEDSGGHPIGKEVGLDGSRSSDPDGDELEFFWSFLSRPEGSEAVIVDADQKTASFIPDVEGDYVVELEVADSEYTDTDTRTITAVETVNLPPEIYQVLVNDEAISREGFRTLPLDSVIEIEVKAKDEDPLAEITVNWEVNGPAGSSADFEDVSRFRKRFEPDLEGFYDFILTANDGQVDSIPFSFVIRFRGDNKLPVAVLTTTADGQVAFPNETSFVLDGSGSYDTDDPEDDIVLYHFELIQQPLGEPQTLMQKGPAPTASFTPKKKGIFRFQLIVEDRMGGVSEPATLEIESLNRPPIARAQTSWSASLNSVHVSRLEDDHPSTSVQLNAMRTGQHASADPDGDVLVFLWEVVDKPEGSNPCFGLKCDETSSNASVGFYTDEIGTYEVKLTVSDQDTGSDELIVTIDIY